MNLMKHFTNKKEQKLNQVYLKEQALIKRIKDEQEKTNSLTRKMEHLKLAQEHLRTIEKAKADRNSEKSRQILDFNKQSQLLIEYSDIEKFSFAQQHPELRPFEDRHSLFYNQSRKL